ncbi:MAG: hypothetical protein KA717_32210 [Woronichinia naegeliana WA131]|jgi:hypothetical protein|uniref:Uncharacterized protein n=1 Tax=Woronichinia naegeliana WA131 TaxID=2824559 RepID=A0A977KUM0_9CYAN|nr:MAG: hypothetical protein KA717_32210 [Woronichinia naegeliana WA131]
MKLFRRNFSINIPKSKSWVPRSKSWWLSIILFVISILLIVIPAHLIEQKYAQETFITHSATGIIKKKILLTILFTIGSAIFSSWVYFVWFQKIIAKQEELEQKAAEKIPFSKREFIEKIEDSKSNTSIIIMETWTELLLDDLGEKFEKAIMKLFNHENCGLKILLLDPEKDDLVRERQNALNSGKKPSEYINVKEKICLSLKKIESIIDKLDEKHKDRLEGKLYQTPPSVAIYAEQTELRVTFFKLGKLTTSDDVIKFERESDGGRFFLEHFNMVWNQEKSINMLKIFYLSVEYNAKQFDKIKYVVYEETYYLYNLALQYSLLNNRSQSTLFFNNEEYSFEFLHDEQIAELFYNKYSGLGSGILLIRLFRPDSV